MHFGRIATVKRLALIVTVLAWGALAGGIVAVPALAEIFTYAQGTNGAGGSFYTTGFSGRDFNRVYHKSGTSWSLVYCYPDNHCGLLTTGTVNPLVDPNNQYARSVCDNNNDSSNVTWTCQTTRP